MKQTKLFFAMILMLAIGNVFTSCSKDDNPTPAPAPEKKAIENTELAAALKAKGFTVEGNQLVINDKVKEAKTLDLSGAELTSVSGLDIFPKLEEVNLSGNKFEAFDFDQLPKGIKSVNIKGNPILEFSNLKADRKFQKLYLPSVAQFDMGMILDYYKANKDDASLDMKYESNGKLVEYNLLRNVVDDHFREVLKELFPSVFTGDQIDLSKELTEEEATKDLELGGEYDTSYDKVISSMDGVQFIICNDNYKGIVRLKFLSQTPVSYFKAPKNAKMLILRNVAPKGVFDLSTAINTTGIALIKVGGIKKLDLSNNIGLGNVEMASQYDGSFIKLVTCEDLEEVVMPKAWDKREIVGIGVLAIQLPKLKKIDLSKVTRGSNTVYAFAKLPKTTEVIFPKTMSKFTLGNTEYTSTFMVDKDFSERETFKEFSEKFKDVVSVQDFPEQMMMFL